MGITAFIALFILALFIATIYLVCQGIKNRDWKRIVFPTILFTVIVAGVYWALVCFITSM